MKKLFFTVATTCGCAFFACAEQVQNWFSGGVASSVPTAVNGEWTSPSEGVTTNETSFALELGYDKTLDFTPTANAAPDTNVVTRVVFVAQFEPQKNGALPSPDPGVKAALMVSNTAYYAYANGAWTNLENENVSVSENLVTVLMEVDYKAEPRARFGIISDNVTNYLHAVGAEAGSWLALGDSTPTPALVKQVSFAGEGVLHSLRGDVQFGIFEVNHVKYGTSGDAVTNALNGADHTITVLRDNNETITIPSDAKVAVKVEPNGHQSGALDNKSNEPTTVELSAAIVDRGNGDYVLTDKDKVNGKYVLHTTDDTKDVAAVTNGEDEVVARVTTKDSVISGNLTVAGKTLTVNDKLRDYLNAYSDNTKVGSYSGKQSNSNTINEDLASVPTGATRTMGQSYALGLAPTEAVILQPAAADTSATAVMLNMPNVAPNSDFTVKYKAQKYDGAKWGNVDDKDPTDTPQIPVGSGRFRVNTVIAPAQ